MRLASCAILAIVVAGCGEEARPEPVAEPSREPIVRDAQEAADWISETLTFGRPKPGGLLAEDRGPRLFAAGAYIGELSGGTPTAGSGSRRRTIRTTSSV
jgi:hypothetical protein